MSTSPTDQTALLWNAPRPPPRKQRPGEPLWSVRVNGATWEAELRYHGEYGVEAQIFKQGEFLIGRRFDTRELAIQWAKLERAELEGKAAREDGRSTT